MSETTLEFVTLRQPQRINEKVKRLRFIRDLRDDATASFRQQLKNSNVYRDKIILAQGFVSGPHFFTTDDFYTLRIETAVDIMREHLRGPLVRRDGQKRPGTRILALIKLIEIHLPVIGQSNFFHAPNLPPAAVSAIFRYYSAMWDSLLSVFILASIHNVQTNYLIDSIRALHLLVALRLENLRQPPRRYWPWWSFDSYEAVISEDVVRYDSLIPV